jgi:predicted transposase YbfD/YdcC
VGFDTGGSPINETPIASLAVLFGDLEDPRHALGRRHQLLDIIAIAICATLSGADTWVDVAAYGRAKETWLRTFLQLPHGIPSHDTFARVFAALDGEQFQACFMQWVRAVVKVLPGQVIAIDGKTACASHDGPDPSIATHMVSAWATANGVVLGQVAVNEKSNEITAIPELLYLLDLKGCLVTIDALGCQKEIAEQIAAQEGSYLLAVKNNQPHLHEDIAHLFDLGLATGFRNLTYDYAVEESVGHGRYERRSCWTLADPGWLTYLRKRSDWPTMRTIALVRSERQVGDEKTICERYYISNVVHQAGRLLAASRAHWQIENRLHWCLDVAFDEDDSRVRRGYGQANLIVLRQLALTLLRRDTTYKAGIKAKRLRAAWDHDYLLKVLTS